jgi:hypothetical protein
MALRASPLRGGRNLVTSMHPVHLKLESGSYWHRVGLFPMGISLVFGWVFVVAWLVVCTWLFMYNPLWSITIGASTVLFSVYLGIMSYRMITDAYRDYTFELTEDEAVLSVSDRLKKKQSTQMVLLDDVKYAEYYPYSDSASVILHAPYADMEVPLWPMGKHGQDVIDFLEGRGVTVVNVQSDDRIPD